MDRSGNSWLSNAVNVFLDVSIIFRSKKFRGALQQTHPVNTVTAMGRSFSFFLEGRFGGLTVKIRFHCHVKVNFC